MEGALVTGRSEVFEPLHTMAEMNSYYKWCMFFLSVTGIWPYGCKKFRFLLNGIVSLITWLSLASQLLAYFSVGRNLLRLLKITSFLSMAMVTCTRYHFAWNQIDDMKGFLDRIRLDWETNNDEILHIMQKCAIFGNRLVLFCAVAAFGPMCMVMICHISPIMLDKILPLNESRAVELPVDFDLLFDKEQYPIITAFLVYLSLSVNVSVLIGTESFLIMLSWHIAGLFHIAR